MLTLEDAMLSRKAVWVVGDNHRKRGPEFDWHQVARKSWVASQGSSRHRGLDQRMENAFVGISLIDSCNWTTWIGWGSLPAFCSKDFIRGCPSQFDRHRC